MDPRVSKPPQKLFPPLGSKIVPHQFKSDDFRGYMGQHLDNKLRYTYGVLGDDIRAQPGYRYSLLPAKYHLPPPDSFPVRKNEWMESVGRKFDTDAGFQFTSSKFSTMWDKNRYKEIARGKTNASHYNHSPKKGW